ncbi:hypothetical protein [Paenibacillus radicis (ex Xue et al. 2023)]|uniref:Uncharacterized protein n=1 Tax=Paenibacillus radicis (ex Xue et al. 2023) TaxID=2972489 RepID=A0ABT1YJY4_9BACL|nr:hypothetical protein [Paenibacillus radicis (ex Xue et al. 2023)]MCR8633487.1 hypothetical protein [Paenibacillus radicis (ex Xue et al. 2023)]
MTTVRVLVDAVGDYNAGDIVKDAPAGLIGIALFGTRNAATGQLLAQIVDEEFKEHDPVEWKVREQELLTQLEYAKNREAELLAQLAEKDEPDEVLSGLKTTAKALKIAGYTKMSADELKTAIEAAGGAGDDK